jgi:hypothetical protein
VRHLNITKQELMALFIDIRTKINCHSQRNKFVRIGASTNNLRIIGWIGGLWFLTNLLAIIGRHLYIFLGNYG